MVSGKKYSEKTVAADKGPTGESITKGTISTKTGTSLNMNVPKGKKGRAQFKRFERSRNDPPNKKSKKVAVSSTVESVGNQERSKTSANIILIEAPARPPGAAKTSTVQSKKRALVLRMQSQWLVIKLEFPRIP